MDVLEAINLRRSVRSYSNRPIPPDVLWRMRRALRSAPSACNNQPWKFIFVTDDSLRRQVAEACCGQNWMAAAPVIVAACALAEQAYKKMGGHGNSAVLDVAIAIDHLTLAAAADGLGTCWIGAFDEAAVNALLGVPPGASICVLTPLGYPASSDLLRPLEASRRKDDGDVFALNRYDGPPGP